MNTPPDEAFTTLEVARDPLLERVPWMTLSTILLTVAYLLAALVDVLPPKLAVPASAAIMVAGALGKALYEIGRTNGTPPTMTTLDSSHEQRGS